MPPRATSAEPPDINPHSNPADLQSCRRCDLWANATQAVPGEGSNKAAVMLVGEQPGDEEDRSGRPFVGPAGRLLEQALHDAGIARSSVFVTNAVNHFKWEPRGKRRIHKTPAQREIAACEYWLERELAQVQPKVIVALGATAARAVLGRTLSIGTGRGQAHPLPEGRRMVVTYHPAAALRAIDPAERARVMALIVEDLVLARRLSSEG